jgi:hypothetical protein
MLPFLTQPAVATACYVPKDPIASSQLFKADGAKLTAVLPEGNRRKWTANLWLSRHSLGSAAWENLFGAWVSGYYDFLAFFGHKFTLHRGIQGDNLQTAGVFRDIAWLNVNVAADTAQADAAARLVKHANGLQCALSGFALAQNHDFLIGGAGNYIVGGEAAWGWPRAGMAEIFWVPGVALPATVFGEFNIHGQWVPRATADIYADIAAAGGWGASGFHLDFADPLDPGKDASGQGHHFTKAGFDAGGADTVDSTPTNVFATLNPLLAPFSGTLSDGNLKWATNTGEWQRKITGSMVIPRTGRWFWEVAMSGSFSSSHRATVGLAYVSSPASSPLEAFWESAGQLTLNGVSVAAPTFAPGDVIGVDYCPDSEVLNFLKNGVLAATINDVVGGPWVPASSDETFTGTPIYTYNFGQRPWSYPASVPADAMALCTASLPEPNVQDPAEGFAQETGTGANIMALLDAATAHWDGAPFVEIIKRRDVAESWRVRFSDDLGNAWATNNANAKAAAPALTAGGSYVGYRFRIGTKYGAYTAEVAHVNGAATTVTHGLATTRNAVIATRVSVGGGDRWYRHPDLPAGKLFKLNSNAAAATDGTITNFGASGFDIAAAAPSGTYRVWVLAEVPGFMEFVKYTGIGSLDGAFGPASVLPRFMHFKADYAALSQATFDAARDHANPAIRQLSMESDAIEFVNTTGTAGYNEIDAVVGGVKARSYNGTSNWPSAITYCLLIGRPIGGVCVAPATAR